MDSGELLDWADVDMLDDCNGPSYKFTINEESLLSVICVLLDLSCEYEPIRSSLLAISNRVCFSSSSLSNEKLVDVSVLILMEDRPTRNASSTIIAHASCTAWFGLELGDCTETNLKMDSSLILMSKVNRLQSVMGLRFICEEDDSSWLLFSTAFIFTLK